MEAVQIIKKLKHFSFEYDENEKRDLVDIKKFIKDEYSYGFIINKINDEYEVYMFVVSDKEDVIASSLLYRNFKKLESAKEYFNSIINEYSNLLLDDLYTRYFSGTN